MGYFPVSYDSRVVIYERKMFIRLAIVQIRKNSYMLLVITEYYYAMALTNVGRSGVLNGL